MNSTELHKIKTSQESKYSLTSSVRAHSCGWFMFLGLFKPIGSILLITKKRLVNWADRWCDDNKNSWKNSLNLHNILCLEDYMVLIIFKMCSLFYQIMRICLSFHLNLICCPKSTEVLCPKVIESRTYIKKADLWGVAINIGFW